jgi:hypothetical protein
VNSSESLTRQERGGGIVGLLHSIVFEDGLVLGGMVGLDKGGCIGSSKNRRKASRVLTSFAFENL